MAQNIVAALADMKESIEGLSWSPRVTFEDQEKGTRKLVSIIPADVEEDFQFGRTKVTHTLRMRLHLSANDAKDTATVQKWCREINAALRIDRRRGGNALTTIVAPWSDEENNGRQGVIMVSEPQIQIEEFC